MESFFKNKIFKSLKEVKSLFSMLKTLRVKKVMESFFDIKNFKSFKAVVEFFLSFKSFKLLCSCSENFWNSRWKCPHVSNNCLWKLFLTGFFLFTLQLISLQIKSH